MWANRRIPGLLLMGIGGGPELPGDQRQRRGHARVGVGAARRRARRVHDRFANSTAVAHPKLQFLGDVFALPSSWPLHNVFSVGDVLIVLGALVGAHVITRSRLVPTGRGELASLRHRPDFVRLWIAQAVSNLGDWIYALAVATTVAGRPDGARILAALLVCQFGPSALVSALGGSLVDRLSRKRLMLGADLLRALAVVSLLVAGSPSSVHLCAVAAAIGLFGGLFQPSLQASLPNVVASDQLVAANALMGATLNMAIMVGPILGGVMAASLGADVAFAVNAASFALSAALIAMVRLPRRSSAEPVAAAPVRDLVDGFRYIVTARVVRGVMVVVGIVIVAAAIKNPVEPLFILRTLGERPASLGLAGTIWGLGMVLGSAIAPAAARRWSRPSLLSVSIALVGLAILGASRATVLTPLLILWLMRRRRQRAGHRRLRDPAPGAHPRRLPGARDRRLRGGHRRGLPGGRRGGRRAGGRARRARRLRGVRRGLPGRRGGDLAPAPGHPPRAGGRPRPRPSPSSPRWAPPPVPARSASVHPTAAVRRLCAGAPSSTSPPGTGSSSAWSAAGWRPSRTRRCLSSTTACACTASPALPQLAPDGPRLRAGFPVPPRCSPTAAAPSRSRCPGAARPAAAAAAAAVAAERELALAA